MTQKEDSTFEKKLQDNSAISRLYQQSTSANPSSQTDQIILDAARRAVAKKSASVSPFGQRWFIPAALAAVLVLTVSVILLQTTQVDKTEETTATTALNDSVDITPVAEPEPAISTKIPGLKKEIATAEQDPAAAPDHPPQGKQQFISASGATPEKWLEKIITLLKKNKKEEAISEYRLFRKALPDYQIDFKKYSELKEIADKIQP